MASRGSKDRLSVSCDREDLSEISSQSEASNDIPINIDLILEKLTKLLNEKPNRKAELSVQEIYALNRTVKEIFIKQDVLLELKAPINICGDIHGQYYDLLRIFAYGGMPPQTRYLFLGDYVDRGKFGIQTICLLYCLKIKFPQQIFLLRGNHQTHTISYNYGFFNECKTRYHVKVWKAFLASFATLPVAALVEQKILCMHGGLSPNMRKIDQIRSIERPTQVPDQGLICDLLWADPTITSTGWTESQRGCSYNFGSDVTTLFRKANNIDLICRAHQVVQDGYDFCHKKQVVTIFSAPNYTGEFNNAGAFMRVQQNLLCSFCVLKPHDKVGGLKNSKPSSMNENMED